MKIIFFTKAWISPPGRANRSTKKSSVKTMGILGLLSSDGTFFNSSRSLVTKTIPYLINCHQGELVDSPVDEENSILEILAPGGAKTIVCFS